MLFSAGGAGEIADSVTTRYSKGYYAQNEGRVMRRGSFILLCRRFLQSEIQAGGVFAPRLGLVPYGTIE